VTASQFQDILAFLKLEHTKPLEGLVYVSEITYRLNYKLRMDLSDDNKFDSLFIPIINTKSRNKIIGVIYKPPDMDAIKFNEDQDKTLKIISKEPATYWETSILTY